MKISLPNLQTLQSYMKHLGIKLFLNLSNINQQTKDLLPLLYRLWAPIQWIFCCHVHHVCFFHYSLHWTTSHLYFSSFWVDFVLCPPQTERNVVMMAMDQSSSRYLLSYLFQMKVHLFFVGYYILHSCFHNFHNLYLEHNLVVICLRTRRWYEDVCSRQKIIIVIV